MSDEKIIQGEAREPTKDENFYIEWGYETVKSNINTANEVFKLLITINVTLIGGGSAFLYKSNVLESYRIIILAAFLIGLILALIGIFPKESEVDIRIPEKIKTHKIKVLGIKRDFLKAASTLTVLGLLASVMAVSGINICF